MSKEFKVKSVDYYELLENQMKYLTILFGVVTIVLGFFGEKYLPISSALGFSTIILGLLIGYYSKKKKFCESLYKTWVSEHPDEVALRFFFNDNNNVDLGIMVFVLKIDFYDSMENYTQNFLAKEAEIYFKVGSYKLTIISDLYKDKEIGFSVGHYDLQKRIYIQANLEKK